MALNLWQKINNVIPGRPFGRGNTATTSISGTYGSGNGGYVGVVSGTAGNSTLTVPNGWGWTGLGLVHQTQGTGAGQWEIIYVNSIASTTASLNAPLQYSYGTGAQCILFFEYDSLTVGSINNPGWDGSSGGISVYCARDTITYNGTVNATTTGFRTPGAPGGHASGAQGEGAPGAAATSTSPNGNGGGGGQTISATQRGGGGGGAGGVTATGGQGYNGSVGGGAGTAYGATDATTIVLGGAGGQGGEWDGGGSQGGRGGGIIIMIAKNITQSGSGIFTTSAGNGSSGAIGRAGGGGGGAGSILLVGDVLSIGTDKFTMTGGTGGVGESGYSGYGGNGSNGRITTYYNTSITGSITSSIYGTYTNSQDTSLIETNPETAGNYSFFM